MTIHDQLNKAIGDMPARWADPTVEVADTMAAAMLIYRATFGMSAKVEPMVVWNMAAAILARHDDPSLPTGRTA